MRARQGLQGCQEAGARTAAASPRPYGLSCGPSPWCPTGHAATPGRTPSLARTLPTRVLGAALHAAHPPPVGCTLCPWAQQAAILGPHPIQAPRADTFAPRRGLRATVAPAGAGHRQRAALAAPHAAGAPATLAGLHRSGRAVLPAWAVGLGLGPMRLPRLPGQRGLQAAWTARTAAAGLRRASLRAPHVRAAQAAAPGLLPGTPAGPGSRAAHAARRAGAARAATPGTAPPRPRAARRARQARRRGAGLERRVPQ